MLKKITGPQGRTKNLVIFIAVLSVAIISPVAYLSFQAQKNISEQFIFNATDHATGKFREMADSMEATLRLVRDWGATELFSIDDTVTLNRLLFPIFDRNKLLYGISIADIDGNSYYVRLAQEGLRTRQIDAKRKTRQAVVTLWEADGSKGAVDVAGTSYDPRQRPWFAPALSREDVYWTEPYRFYDSDNVGITASISFLQKSSKKQMVVAFDIILDKLFNEIHKLAPSSNSRIFIIRRDTELYIAKSNESGPNFVQLSAVQDSLLQKVSSIWKNGGSPASKTISIQHEGTTWWSGFMPLDKARGSTWVCVMVPENDIVGKAAERKTKLWIFGLASVLFAIGATLWISRSFGQKEGSAEITPFDVKDPENSILKIIERGEGPTIEFKSTIRMNLHTKKPGKEIELAWLKSVAAFLNTNGGILLLGVTDSGEISGLEKDVFENEDKCKLHFKNLVANHLGAALSKYIDFEIFPVQGKTVGVVRCKRSSEPVFLTMQKGEAFYIRNGPSSDELPVSKALDYIKRKKY